MGDETRAATTRRNVLRNIAVGGVALGGATVGGSSSVAASRFCGFDSQCVRTTHGGVKAHNDCPLEDNGYVWNLDEGVTGVIMETCSDDDNCYAKVEFECEEVWWVPASSLTEDMLGCYC